MRISKIQELFVAMCEKKESFESRTGIRLSDDTFYKVIRIVNRLEKVEKKYGSEAEKEAVAKFMDAFDSSETEKELLRALKKIIPQSSTPIPEDERIYLNTSYETRQFAKAAHCRFDSEKKLWYTGSQNRCLAVLIAHYGVNEATSEKAMNLLKEKQML